MKKATLICDMQYGSTGKGLIAGYLAERDKPDTLVTSWSANAGHTYIDREGNKYVHCMLANGVVSPNLKRVMIGPGSQLCIETLAREIRECCDFFYETGAVVIIHENATVIQPRHVEIEGGSMTGIGSTKKGCGAALVEKISRRIDFFGEDPIDGPVWGMSDITVGQLARHGKLKETDFRGVRVVIVNQRTWMDHLYAAERIQIEGAQGYSLGINSGFYPFTTSRECTPAQILSDCGVPMDFLDRVVGTLRTFPIRVANRYDEDGKMVGWSGPSYPDQYETSFEALGVAQELTTVTKLPRRVFTFSTDQLVDAMMHIRPDEVFINFANYTTQLGMTALIVSVEAAGLEIGKKPLLYAGYGPSAKDVFQLPTDEDYQEE